MFSLPPSRGRPVVSHVLWECACLGSFRLGFVGLCWWFALFGWVLGPSAYSHCALAVDTFPFQSARD